MSNAIDAHLTDEVINAAFTNTNFGRDDFRTILAETVLKRAAGYPQAGRQRPFACDSASWVSRKDQQN